ncbi:N-acetyl-gamma-glutamyl-phosphate reductase, partial [Escherichia coli]|nr:N-acetyl-gamma-glutamyl-phosphate reductase [Escherichia coli]
DQGTTGLQIQERLRERADLQLLTLPAAERKDPVRRADALNACDIAILCLPDAAAREAVGFIRNPTVRV